MLVPNEGRVAQQYPQASLLSAVTSIFQAPVDTLRTGAGRNSFSVSFCGVNADLSRLWRGSEQTAYK